MPTSIRAFGPEDADQLDQVAARAFAEYDQIFGNWEQLYEEWSHMSQLSNQGEIMVALNDELVVGAVCYIPSGAPKPSWFEQEWGLVRSLVVDPGYRGRGIGTDLMHACIGKATEDGCHVLALQTTPFMERAVSIYERLGFSRTKALGEARGVEWFLYCKQL